MEHQRARASFFTIFAIVALSPALCAAQSISGPEPLSTFGDGRGEIRDVARSANGDTVFAWVDPVRGISLIQRIDAAGVPRYRDGRVLAADHLAMDAAGNLLAVRDAPDGSGVGVFATLLDRFDNVVVPEFRVNDTTAGEQYTGQGAGGVAMNAAGEFVIVWTSVFQGTAYSVPMAKRYRSDGTALGPEVLVATRSSRGCPCPSAGIDQNGNVVVTYTLEDLRQTFGDVFIRRLDASGRPVGGESMVNTTTPDLQRQSRIAVAPYGEFVVVWESRVSGVGWPVYAQRYTREGARFGGEIRVDAFTSYAEALPEVEIDENGAFVVAWSSNEGNGVGVVRTRSYDYSISPLGPPQAVDSGVAFPLPRLAMDVAGNFTVAYSNATNGLVSAYYQRYTPYDLAISPLSSGQTVSGISGTAYTFTWPLTVFRYFRLTVPAGTSRMVIAMDGTGGAGDADLYVRRGLLPSLGAWDIRPYLTGSTEGAVIDNPPPGDWYVGIAPFTSFYGVALSVQLQ